MLGKLKPRSVSLPRKGLDRLVVRDERSFRHVALYGQLKDVLLRARYAFRVLPHSQSRSAPPRRADHALLLNLTYWAPDAGGDVLQDATLDADVVTHVAWHHLATNAVCKRGQPPAVLDLFLGETVASAFDLYLVGRLLGYAPESSFLRTQVPAMAETAQAAGATEGTFRRILESLADDPAGAFSQMRELLWDVLVELDATNDVGRALQVLRATDRSPLGPLLHRYELSNWLLYARAYANRKRSNARALAVDAALRAAPSAIDWLTEHWVVPALSRP